jgi:hypothetical protein
MKVLSLLSFVMYGCGDPPKIARDKSNRTKSSSTDFSGFKSLVNEYFTAMEWGTIPPEIWQDFNRLITYEKNDKVHAMFLDAIGTCYSETERNMKLRRSDSRVSPHRIFGKSLIELFAAVHAISRSIDPKVSPEDQKRYEGDGNAILRSIKADSSETAKMFSQWDALVGICEFYNQQTSNQNDCKADAISIMKGQLIAEAGKNTGMTNLEKLRIGDSKRALRALDNQLKAQNSLSEEDRNNMALSYVKIRDGLNVFLSRDIDTIKQRNFDAALILSELTALLPNMPHVDERSDQEIAPISVKRRKVSRGNIGVLS